MTVNNRVFIRGKCGRKFGRRNGFVRYFLRQATIGLDDAAWSCALEVCEDAPLYLIHNPAAGASPACIRGPLPPLHFTSASARP